MRAASGCASDPLGVPLRRWSKYLATLSAVGALFLAVLVPASMACDHGHGSRGGYESHGSYSGHTWHCHHHPAEEPEEEVEIVT
ncbi:MAG TPA: hypothetical protein VMT37_10085 [Solirubrobacterales bacterium]|nr:hypothetical protein [Solirubrobacterales bacterium]